MSTALKFARNEKCHDCAGYRHCPLWNWARCKPCGVDINGDPVQELNDDFMDGPVSNCPNHLWDGVKEKTQEELSAERVAMVEVVSTRLIQKWGPVFKAVPTKAEIDTALDEIGVNGKLDVDIIVQLKADLAADISAIEGP